MVYNRFATRHILVPLLIRKIYSHEYLGYSSGFSYLANFDTTFLESGREWLVFFEIISSRAQPQDLILKPTDKVFSTF